VRLVIVHAPVNGFVTNLTLDVGRYAAVGTKIMTLIDSDTYRVTGYFEKTKIPAVKESGQVDIYLMSGGPVLRGHVESISRGITDHDDPAGPELLAKANPTFEWVLLAQRIPLRIHIYNVPKGVLISSGHDLHRRRRGAAAPMGDPRGTARTAGHSAINASFR
jgi:multidrug resistance efflux pump